MTGPDLRKWRLDHYMPGRSRPLTQREAGKLLGASDAEQSWWQWENGKRRVPYYVPGFLRLLDSHNEMRRELQPKTLVFLGIGLE